MVFDALGPDNQIRRDSMACAELVVPWITARCRREALKAGGFGQTIYASCDTGDITDATGVDLVGLEFAAINGPLSVQGEWMQASVDSTAAGNPDLSSYYLFASYFLTGEHRVYKASSATFGRVRPKHNYLGDGGSGALELALRYSSADLADANVSGGELDNITLGLNWYLNPNTRVMLNYTAADLAGTGDSNIAQARFQIDF